MSTVSIRIATPFRAYTHNIDEVKVDAGTIKEALAALGANHAELLPQILADDGEPRQFVNLYLGNQNIRSLTGLQTPLADGDVVSIIPAVAGGSRHGSRRSSDQGRAGTRT